jgi:high affinity Mn2+ porin
MTMRGPICSDGTISEDAAPMDARRMPSCNPRWDRALVAATLGMLALAKPAAAADVPLDTLPLKANALKTKAAVRQAYDWTGFYIGGHFGYGGGSLGPDTNPLPLQGVLLPHSVTGVIGGYQVGYNRELANHVVLGVEADASFAGAVDQIAVAGMRPTSFNTTIDYVGTLRGRLGYAFDRLMPYATAGFAWGHPHAEINDGSGAVVGRYQPGWTVGLGVEYALGGNWSVKLEYDYVDLARRPFAPPHWGSRQRRACR